MPWRVSAIENVENAVELREVFKTFSKGRYTVFKDLTLNIPKGKVTFILGPSGVGKSVMLKHILGLLSPDKGDVLIFGKKIPYKDPEALNEMRKHFGMLFQNAALFDDLTVFENVAFPLREHRRKMKIAEVQKIVEEKLLDVGLDPKTSADKYPSELSGGMKKRVGLARAIVLNPEILLYDEPTTGLDPVTRAMVDDLILETNKKFNLTSVVISHDIPSALYSADQIAFLFEGKIVFLGTSQEFLKCEHPVPKKFLESEQRHRMGVLQ